MGEQQLEEWGAHCTQCKALDFLPFKSVVSSLGACEADADPLLAADASTASNSFALITTRRSAGRRTMDMRVRSMTKTRST